MVSATDSMCLALQLVDINPRPQSAGVQFAGLDIVDNGLLNGLPLEPPNPAICVGNGFVLEATNDVRPPTCITFVGVYLGHNAAQSPEEQIASQW